MKFLNKQIHYTSSFKRKILVGLILGIFLSFVIIVLEPFDTDKFNPNHKLLVLSVFGVLIFCAFVVYTFLENFWYIKLRKTWRFYHELISAVVFFTFAGSVIYLYNGLVINREKYSVYGHLFYLRTIVLAMIPVVAPLMIYLRQKLGERILPADENTIVLAGENKNELLQLHREKLLFVRAVENYVEITFIDDSGKVNSKTFRQTLSAISGQLPFLKKCHRSYLVNLQTVKAIKGNSQSATVSFVHCENEIPLSKTYYREIKDCILH